MKPVTRETSHPVFCAPSQEVTEANNYTAKRRVPCPENGLHCAVKQLRLLGALPLGEAVPTGCALGQLEVLESMYSTPEPQSESAEAVEA